MLYSTHSPRDNRYYVRLTPPYSILHCAAIDFVVEQCADNCRWMCYPLYQPFWRNIPAVSKYLGNDASDESARCGQENR